MATAVPVLQSDTTLSVSYAIGTNGTGSEELVSGIDLDRGRPFKIICSGTSWPPPSNIFGTDIILLKDGVEVDTSYLNRFYPRVTCSSVSSTFRTSNGIPMETTR